MARSGDDGAPALEALGAVGRTPGGTVEPLGSKSIAATRLLVAAAARARLADTPLCVRYAPAAALAVTESTPAADAVVLCCFPCDC